jgi:hypothetical protein
MTAPDLSLARSMGKVIVWNAHDTADARLLLEALGLIDGPDGHELLPIDPRPMPLADHHAPPGAHTQSVTTTEQRPENCTTPPGLRHLPPAAAAPAAAAPARPATPRTTSPGTGSDPKPRRDAARCGTASGYNAHRRRKETVCQPCLAAERARMNDRTRRQAVAAGRTPGPRPPAEHGTNTGYHAHRRRGEEACDPCKAATAAYSRARTAARRLRAQGAA